MKVTALKAEKNSFVSIYNIGKILFLSFLETLASQSLISFTKNSKNYYICYENYDIEIYFYDEIIYACELYIRNYMRILK
jgi:hypothetical protein